MYIASASIWVSSQQNSNVYLKIYWYTKTPVDFKRANYMAGTNLKYVSCRSHDHQTTSSHILHSLPVTRHLIITSPDETGTGT